MGTPEKHYLYIVIGLRVKQYRNQLGLSQEMLAAAIGLERTSITNVEKGIQKVSLLTLYRIADYLDITIYDLIPATITNDLLTPTMLGMLPFDEVNGSHTEGSE